MGRFWYTLTIPQSVPRKLLLHNGFRLVGRLGHFETPSRENKLIRLLPLSCPAFCPLVRGLAVSSIGFASTVIYAYLQLSTPKGK